jgi:hypothetical protein
MESRAFVVGLIVGILATVTMDVVAVMALRLGIAGRGPRRTGPDLIGRWMGYLLQGKFRHTDIDQRTDLRFISCIDFLAHGFGSAVSFIYYDERGTVFSLESLRLPTHHRALLREACGETSRPSSFGVVRSPRSG